MNVPTELLAVAKVQALTDGRAVRVVGRLRVEPDSDAFILAPIKMAGEERLWAVAFGTRGDDPRVVCAADSRNRDDEHENVLRPLAQALDDYFEDCRSMERAPQVWVTSGAAVRLLDALGDRRGSRDYPDVARIGRHAWFLADRYHYTGQQVLIPAVDALTAHFATGQSTTEDQHLGALLAWIDPPSGTMARQAADNEEDVPAGVATDPAVDMTLADRLTELAALRREDRDPRRQAAIAEEIRSQLEPVARRVHGLIGRSIDVLERQGLDPLPGIEGLRGADWRAFDFYMLRGFIPSRFSAKESSQQFAGRESAIDGAEAAILDGDPLMQALARLEGEILEGKLAHLEFGTRANTVERCTIETTQLVSKIRVGDVLRLDVPRNIRVQVLEMSAPDASGTRRLFCRVTNGKTLISVYDGVETHLLPGSGGYFDRAASRIKAAHDAELWVLQRDVAPPAPARADAPDDPESALEALR